MMRLQKYLAHCGICSRRKAEEHILNGDVMVNGKAILKLGTKIDPAQDQVQFKGKKVALEGTQKKIYIALNKPVGVVSSCSHPNAKIVLDLVKIKERVYPVGRLDKDSCGLILLTNDGELHNRLSHPSFDHEKEYVVTTRQPISSDRLKQMADGIVLNKKKTRQAKVTRLGASSFTIILKQGRNRQIRRMVDQCRNTVKTLKRTRIADIRLGDLKKGQWRFLNPREIERLTQY